MKDLSNKEHLMMRVEEVDSTNHYLKQLVREQHP